MRDWLSQRYGVVSAVLGAAGIALILLAELAHTDWTKLFGALLITAGGIGIGVWFGLAPPRPWPLRSLVSRWRLVLGVGAAVVLAAPAVAALLVTLYGLFDGDGRSAQGATVAAGALIAVVLAGAVAMTLWTGIRAIGRADRADRAMVDGTDGPAG